LIHVKAISRPGRYRGADGRRIEDGGVTGLKRVLVAVVVVAGAATAGAYWWQERADRLPDYIASGNGRIEAEEIHVATKQPGRVIAVTVDEGDMVERGQIIARMDTAELESTLARAVAKAQIAQRRSELTYADQELGRARFLLQKGHVPRERLDQRQSQRDAAQAALEAAQANLISAERSVEAALAEGSRIETLLDDTVLRAPIAGRVQYRLAEPGEVLAAGGRVVTLLDLTNVYMTIFLPTAQAGRIFDGAEGRIILDAVPEIVIPAKVSFVASEAQFTPRTVETRSEREKLMFRVKVRIAPDLLRAHLEKVRTGLPGEAYIRMGPNGEWPAHLAAKLPLPR
jgi:HlyD family secretion protein